MGRLADVALVVFLYAVAVGAMLLNGSSLLRACLIGVPMAGIAWGVGRMGVPGE